MDKNDEEKTLFITEDGIYYYKAMSFEIKNGWVAY